MKLAAIFSLISLLFCFGLSASEQLNSQRQLNFSIDTEQLSSQLGHYSFQLSSATELLARFPEVRALDFDNLLSLSRSRYLFNKIAFIVERPIEEFSADEATDFTTIRRLMPDYQVRQTDENNSFRITDRGVFGYHYYMDIFTQDPTHSNLEPQQLQAARHSVRIVGISATPELTIVRRIRDFSKYSRAGISITHHFAIGREQTLIVTYNLSAIRPFYAIERIIYPNFKDEVEQQIRLLN